MNSIQQNEQISEQPLIKNQSATSLPSPIFMMFVVAFVFLIIGVGVGYYLTTSNLDKQSALEKSPTVSEMTVSPSKAIGEICEPYGVLELPEEFLEAYIVKAGDTPESIIENNFGNTARLNEFITINKDLDLFTGLESSLSAGMNVYLPPKEVEKTSGSLFAITGQLKRVVDKDLWLRTRTINSEEGDSPVRTNARTKFIKTPKVGECVKAVIDKGSGGQVLFITTY